jgi:hypothetical protein
VIALLRERFGGAAEEGELLCRLPWRLRRLERCFGAPGNRQSVSVAEHRRRKFLGRYAAPSLNPPEMPDRSRHLRVHQGTNESSSGKGDSMRV